MQFSFFRHLAVFSEIYCASFLFVISGHLLRVPALAQALEGTGVLACSIKSSAQSLTISTHYPIVSVCSVLKTHG